MRKLKEIQEYETEAFDKVWYMRSHPSEHPTIEENRLKAIERIEKEYPEVLNGFSDWDCGYWNGVMGALRWVMGDEKDFLDT